MRKIIFSLLGILLVISGVNAIEFRSLIPPDNDDLEKSIAYQKVNDRIKIAVATVADTDTNLGDLKCGRKLLIYNPETTLPVPLPNPVISTLKTQLRRYSERLERILSSSPDDYYGNYSKHEYTVSETPYYSDQFATDIYDHYSKIQKLSSTLASTGGKTYLLRSIPYFPLPANSAPVAAYRNTFDASINYGRMLSNFDARLPYTVSISYNSLLERDGVAGYNWIFNFEKEIIFVNNTAGENFLVLSDSSGRGILFQYNPGSSRYEPLDKSAGIMYISGNFSSYRVYYKNGLIEEYQGLQGEIRYKPSGIKLDSEDDLVEPVNKMLLVSIEDRTTEKHEITFEYDSELKLTQIKTDQYDLNSGIIFEVFYDMHKRVERIKDSYSREWTFEYDTQGDLTKLNDLRGRSWSFEYTQYGFETGEVLSSHYISKIFEDADSFPMVQFEKETTYTYWRDDSQGVPEYSGVAFGAMNSPEGIARYVASNITTVDSLNEILDGKQICLIFNKFGVSARQSDQQSSTISFKNYNESLSITSEQLSEDFTNTSGDNSEVTGSSGGWIEDEFDGGDLPPYDPSGTPTITDENLVVLIPNLNDVTTGTEITYDDDGNVTRVQDEYGNSVQAQYDLYEDFPYPDEVRDKNENVTILSWDKAAWKLREIEHPDGSEKRFGHNDDGDLLSQQEFDPLNQPSAEVVYSYDTRGRMLAKQRTGSISTVDPATGNTNETAITEVTSYLYDALGRVSEKSVNGDLTDSFTYDDFNRVLTHMRYKDSADETVVYEYNLRGDLIRLTDGEGNITSYTHDLSGKVTKTEYPLTTETYRYSPDGALVEKTLSLNSNPAQSETTKYYQDYDHEIERFVTKHIIFDTKYDKQRREFDYDKELNITEVTDHYKDGTQIIKEYEYDLLNRPALVKTLFADKEFNVGYSYDDNGNVTSRTMPFETGGTQLLVNLAYDNMNRVISQAFPDLGTFLYSYSSCCGLLDSITYPDGKTVTYDYDELKNLKKIDNPYASYEYLLDDRGNRIGLFETFKDNDVIPQELRGKTLKNYFNYDNQNQLTAASYYNGVGTSYSYDNVGNRVRATSFILGTQIYGDITLNPGNYRTEEYDYDGENRLIGQDVKIKINESPLLLLNGSKDWEYNVKGELTVQEDENSSNLGGYFYGPEGRLGAVTKDGNVLGEYTFSPTGERLKRTYKDPQTDEMMVEYYIYDGANCVYDLDGSKQIKKTYFNGPGIDNILAFEDNKEDKDFYIFKDALGSTRQVVEITEDGFEWLHASYGYGAWGEIVDYCEGGVEYSYTAGTELPLLEDAYFKDDPQLYGDYLYFLKSGLIACDAPYQMPRKEDMVSPNKSIERYDLDTDSSYTLVPAADYSGIPPSIWGYPMTYTNAFINPYYRRDGDLYRIQPGPSNNDFLVCEDVNEGYFAVETDDSSSVILFNITLGVQKVTVSYHYIDGWTRTETNVIPASAVQSFNTIKSNETGMYFTAKLTGDIYTNIYRINDDLTYERLTDDTADYTNLVPKADEETFAVLKYDGTETDIVLFKVDTGEETVITENIDSFKYEAIGWNAGNTLYAYDITTGYTPGTSCPYQIYPVTHKVRKRNIEIFAYSTSIEAVYSMGSYGTVMKSKPSITSYNGSDHIIYSKHFNTKSDIYAIPVERIANISNEPDVFDYETWFAAQDTGGGTVIGPIPIGIGGDIGTTPGGGVIDDPINITDPVQRTEYANLNFNPYKKKLENGPVIRYLYTGREMNIETGDYYYRMRMMDSSVGRFSSKDPILYLNLYRYVGNNPMRFRDRFGLDPEDEDENDVDWMCENWGSIPPGSMEDSYTVHVSQPGHPEYAEGDGQSFIDCVNNCIQNLNMSQEVTDEIILNKNNYDETLNGFRLMFLGIYEGIQIGRCYIQCAGNTGSHTAPLTPEPSDGKPRYGKE
ncbi:RHS repeat-associated core domain-containing protein [bacterium]|nr:RHS repeat-associated core domain-containing protein [bacterium]